MSNNNYVSKKNILNKMIIKKYYKIHTNFTKI